MVGDHGQVVVAPLVGDLIDTEPVEAVEPAVVETVSDDSGDGAMDGLPGDAEQPADAGLVGPLRQPGDHVLQITGKSGSGPRPRDLFGTNPAATAAVDAGDVCFEPHGTAAHVEMPPPPTRQVIAGTAAPPTWADMPPLTTPQADHDPGLGELDRFHPSPSTLGSHPAWARLCSA